jgi:hypothetical protein
MGTKFTILEEKCKSCGMNLTNMPFSSDTKIHRQHRPVCDNPDCSKFRQPPQVEVVIDHEYWKYKEVVDKRAKAIVVYRGEEVMYAKKESA